MKAVVVEEIYNASVQVVWKALTDQHEMKKWYFDLPEFKAEVGFEFKFSGQGVKGENYMHLCKVTQVIPFKKLQYSWKYENYPGQSLVTFDLWEEGPQTRLKLTHSGLESFPQDIADFNMKNFQAGWNEILTKVLVEHLTNKLPQK